jgi:hypothetical protein
MDWEEILKQFVQTFDFGVKSGKTDPLVPREVTILVVYTWWLENHYSVPTILS